MTSFLGSGLAFPLGIDRRGRVALASGDDDIKQAIWLILSTAPGERPMRPEFGCGAHDYIFDVIDAETLGRIELEVRVALERWEPRIELEAVNFDTSEALSGRLEIELEYRLVSTNATRNLVYPFYVIPADETA